MCLLAAVWYEGWAARQCCCQLAAEQPCSRSAPLPIRKVLFLNVFLCVSCSV